MKKLFPIVAITVLVFALFAVACNGGKTTSNTTSATTTTDTKTITTTVTTTTKTAETVNRTKVITFDNGKSAEVYIPDHSMFIMNDCKRCHEDNYCALCHTGKEAAGNHGGGASALPADHSNYNMSNCTLCHYLGDAVATTLDLSVKPDHSSYTFSDCLVCHDGKTATARPDGHDKYTRDECGTCHSIGRPDVLTVDKTSNPDHSQWTSDTECSSCHSITANNIAHQTYFSGKMCIVCHVWGE